MIEAKAVVTNLMAALHIPSNATMDKSLLPEIEERAVAMTTLLLAHGADPDAFALRRHRGLSGVESALADVNLRDKRNRFSAFEACLRTGDLALVKLMMQQNVDVNGAVAGAIERDQLVPLKTLIACQGEELVEKKLSHITRGVGRKLRG
eukprot:1377139-Amorphochlora_amoeboformis.AAC.1